MRHYTTPDRCSTWTGSSSTWKVASRRQVGEPLAKRILNGARLTGNAKPSQIERSEVLMVMVEVGLPQKVLVLR